MLFGTFFNLEKSCSGYQALLLGPHWLYHSCGKESALERKKDNPSKAKELCYEQAWEYTEFQLKPSNLSASHLEEEISLIAEMFWETS